MNSNKFLYLLLIFLFGIQSCGTNSKENKKNGTSDVPIKEVKFKIWMVDTLNVLNTYDFPKELAERKIIVEKDSSELTVFNDYSYLSDDDIESTTVASVRNLLNEYNELPIGKFTLKFNETLFYYPSDSPQLNYDFSNDIENIEIQKEDSLFCFSFNRGSITRKETYLLSLKDSKTRIESVEFIWDDTKLVKRKSSVLKE